MGQKKIFSTRLDSDRIKALKHLAVDVEKSLGVLLEEAIWDLCRKYRQQSTADTVPEKKEDAF